MLVRSHRAAILPRLKGGQSSKMKKNIPAKRESEPGYLSSFRMFRTDCTVHNGAGSTPDCFSFVFVFIRIGQSKLLTGLAPDFRTRSYFDFAFDENSIKYVSIGLHRVLGDGVSISKSSHVTNNVTLSIGGLGFIRRDVCDRR